MFWDIFIKLCAQHNKKPNHVTKALGLSTATATDWKKGSTPRDVTLQKVADYFGVTVDHLLGKEEKKPPMPEGTEDMGENEKRLMAMWSQIPEEQKPELLTLIEAALRMRGEH